MRSDNQAQTIIIKSEFQPKNSKYAYNSQRSTRVLLCGLIVKTTPSMASKQHNPCITLAHAHLASGYWPKRVRWLQGFVRLKRLCRICGLLREHSLLLARLALKKKKKTKLAISSGKNASILQVQVHRVNTGQKTFKKRSSLSMLPYTFIRLEDEVLSGRIMLSILNKCFFSFV